MLRGDAIGVNLTKLKIFAFSAWLVELEYEARF